MNERWVAVPGYGGYYEVSDAGRVRAVPRRVVCHGGTRSSPGVILKTFISQQYPAVKLSRAGKRESWTIHRLVLFAFVGPPSAGMEACHGNGNCSDNRLANLRWDTRQANHRDSIMLGATPRGERLPQTRLTAADVLAIRKAKSLGELSPSIAARHGIHPNHVGKICRREAWAHIP